MFVTGVRFSEVVVSDMSVTSLVISDVLVLFNNDLMLLC